MHRVLLALMLVACRSESVATTTPTETAAASHAPPPQSSSSAVAVAEAAAPPTVDEQLIALTQRWNDALAQHNADALDAVYGAHPSLYGTTLDRAAAIAAKRAALTGDYTQSIASILIVKGDPARPHAVFDKTWTNHGKQSSVRASLAFAKEGGRWVVVEETDSKTEAKLADESCLGLVHKVVLSTDDAATYRKAPYGTMYVCGPPECDTFQIAAIRIEHDLERLASYDVDQKKGVVSHAGVELKADPQLVSRMKAACAREAAEAK
jgi:hypothetical protein